MTIPTTANARTLTTSQRKVGGAPGGDRRPLERPIRSFYNVHLDGYGVFYSVLLLAAPVPDLSSLYQVGVDLESGCIHI